MKINHFLENTAPYLISVIILFFPGCENQTSSTSDDTTSGKESFTEISLDPVVPDGQLETVTWNLEWYGIRGQGPDNEKTQTENILQVIDSLSADLYAFQEVHDNSDLLRITGAMEGYRGFVGEHIDQSLRTAFVYNTATIDSVSSGAITEGQDEFAWAGGRFPLFFEFKYSYQNASTTIYAVVIHAKSFDDSESYQRRKEAAEDLYAYLVNNKPGAHIILLGDYNDDVDQSIYEGITTPYHLFVDNEQHFRVITKVLSEADLTSTVYYSDIIDHITISNELYGNLIDKSEQVFSKAGHFIPDYGTTTSDHYPVWAKFDLSGI